VTPILFFSLLFSPPATTPSEIGIVVTISAQQSPSPLPKGITLYSVEAVSPTARTISAAQIRQAVEGVGISYVENSTITTPASKQTSTLSTLLTWTKYLGGGLTVASGILSAEKASGSAPGNAKTWAEVTAGTAALAAGAMLAQSQLQTALSAAATTTSGVSASLMDLSAIYSIPAGGGLPKSVMFFGSAPSGGPFKTVIQ
jgi:hypothetical protein